MGPGRMHLFLAGRTMRMGGAGGHAGQAELSTKEGV